MSNFSRRVRKAEDPENVLFYSPRFAMEKKNLDQVLRSNVALENITVGMLWSKENWFMVSSAIAKTQKELLKQV